MKFADVKRMRAGKLKQFVRRDNFLNELEFHRVDCESSHGMLDNYIFLREKLTEYEKEDLKPKPLLNGDDLLAMGFQPSPRIKEILERAYLYQLEGKWKTKSEVLTWVRQMYPLGKEKPKKA